MLKRIFVGNLSFDLAEDQMRALFSELGTVETVQLITDHASGHSRGFGFVEMSSGADEAIAALDQKQLNGKTLHVNEALPRGEQASHRRPVLREETTRITPERSTA